MFTVETGQGIQTLDVNGLITLGAGNCVGAATDLEVSDGAAALEISVAAGSYYLTGAEYQFAGGTVTVAAGDSEARKDLVVIDSTGTLSVVPGQPAPQLPQGKTRFETFQPAPPDAAGLSELVLAEVFVAAGADDIGDADIRNRRFSREEQRQVLEELHAEFATHSNEIDSVVEIPAGRGSVVAGELTGTGEITGAGSLAVIDEGIHEMIENPITEDVDGAGHSITGLGAVGTDEATANPAAYSYTGDPAPLNIGTNVTGSRAINIQVPDDSTQSDSFANAYWIAANGERFASVVGSSWDNDLAIYTKGDAFGSGDTSLYNRFEVNGGSRYTRAEFNSLNVLWLTGEQPDMEFRPTNNSADTDTRLWWRDHTDTRRWVLRRRGSSAGQLSITNLDGAGDILSFETDGQINQHGQESKNVVWRSGATGSRPASPVTGQRFFDSDLGQPIWYDGVDWVDAQGTVV